MRRTAVPIGLAAMLALGGVALAQNDVVVKGGKYAGHTHQKDPDHPKKFLPISFKVDASGDYIVKLKYKLVESCSNGTKNTNSFSMGSGSAATIQENETTFKGKQTLAPNSKVKSGVVKLSGNFDSAHHATGKVVDKIVFRKSDPNKRGTCKGQSRFQVKLK